MAFTTAQLTALEEAIASGSLEVTYEGKTIKYASIDDLTKRYNFVQAKLIEQGDLTSAASRTTLAQFSKD